MAKTLTPEQLDAVTIVVAEATGERFCIVQSASDPEKTYQVKWNRQHSCWGCTCPAMNPPVDAYGYFKYSPRVCWHLRTSIEVLRQHAEEKRAEAAAAVRQREERLETFKRVMSAKPACYSEAEIRADQKRFAPRPFSLLH